MSLETLSRLPSWSLQLAKSSPRESQHPRKTLGAIVLVQNEDIPNLLSPEEWHASSVWSGVHADRGGFAHDAFPLPNHYISTFMLHL